MLKEFFYDIFGYNTEIFFLINKNLSSSNIQLALKYLTFLFNISNFAVYYFVAIFFAFLRWKKMKFSKPFFTSTYNEFVRIGICYALIGLTYAFLKFTINMPRPFCSQDPNLFITIMDVSKERCLSSFPSAHSAISILVTYSLWRISNISLKLVLICVSILTMISRVALAMHYPADIIYSIFIVVVIIFSSNFIFRLFKNNLVKIIGEKIYSVLRKTRLSLIS